MTAFSELVASMLNALDMAHQIPNSQLSREDKLYNTIAAACYLMELFLRVHPFVNGNGHISRLLLIAMLFRFGYRLKAAIGVHPRPEAPFVSLIKSYRDGNCEPLELHILHSVEMLAQNNGPPNRSR